MKSYAIYFSLFDIVDGVTRKLPATLQVRAFLTSQEHFTNSTVHRKQHRGVCSLTLCIALSLFSKRAHLYEREKIFLHVLCFFFWRIKIPNTNKEASKDKKELFYANCRSKKRK